MRQLIFTSAPRGVDLGRSGFCTVARSADLGERVCRELERRSTYEPLKDRSPRIYRHQLLNTSEGAVHVLTRFIGGGRDYSGRTNYLAHHLILDPSETVSAPSPAEIFANWTGWRDVWEGPPRLLKPSEGPPLPRHAPLPLPAEAWRSLTGDAGRAALLVAGPGWRVVCQPREEIRLLDLFRESSALMPPGASWDITFTTCLLAGDSAADFHWIGGPSDSPVMAETARPGHLRTLALGAPDQIPVPVSIASQLARHGAPVATPTDLA
jgi:hypothetical protein